MTSPTASTARVTAGLAVAALLGGCGADRHARDDLPLTPQQEHDVFLASDNLGPDTDVIILANVPKARYENGAIVLTGGKQLYVVQPHAWRTYTGTALSAEEARGEVARAERLEVAISDIAAAASELKRYLEGRSSEAAHASARLQEEDATRRSGQEVQQQRLLEEAARVHRARDQEIGRITSARDDQVAAVYKEGGGEIEAVTAAFGRQVDELNQRWAKVEADVLAAYRAAGEKLAVSQKLEVDIARAKNMDQTYLLKQEELHERQRQELSEGNRKRIAELHRDRDAEVAKARTESAARIDDARRLYEAKAERIRRATDDQIAAVRAREDNAAAAGGSAAPAAPTTAPTPAPSAAPATGDGNGGK